MMRLSTFLCIASTLLAGCSDLIIRDSDESAAVAGKVSARIVLGLSTIGISEYEISKIAEKEERQANERKAFERMNQAVGVLTYDEALQRLGPPSAVTEGQEVMIAVWQSAPGPTLMVPMPPVGFGQMFIAGQVPGHGLALTFSQSVVNSDKKILRSWRAW